MGRKKTKKKEQKDKEFYQEQSESLWEDKIREGGKLENIIFLVASGSMVLSATAVLNLVGKIQLIFLPLLWISWLLLALVIIFRLLAYYAIDRCIEHDYKNLDEWWEGKREYETHEPWRKLINFSDQAAFMCVVSGLIFLLSFAYFNIELLNLSRPVEQEYNSHIINCHSNQNSLCSTTIEIGD